MKRQEIFKENPKSVEREPNRSSRFSTYDFTDSSAWLYQYVKRITIALGLQENSKPIETYENNNKQAETALETYWRQGQILTRARNDPKGEFAFFKAECFAEKEYQF